jgi:8-oxo-dGTP diphosphatase
MKAVSPLHVAVGVIRGGDGSILITERAKHAHQGGLWEFPGGKVEAGESVTDALRRELLEEIGIGVEAATPLIKIRHDYGDRHVLLDVWHVTAFSGEARPREGQAMRWVRPDRLIDFNFPAANLPIIKAVQLPDCYAILEGRCVEEVINNCQRILRGGICLVQLRVKSLPVTDLERVAAEVSRLCRRQGVTLLANSDLPFFAFQSDGIHLSSRALLACDRRPDGYALVAASCHNLAELRHAEKLGIDFGVLAPVQATATHPDATPLGWEGLSALLDQVNLPVFALGGLGLEDMGKAINAGAQGLAGISAFLRQA